MKTKLESLARKHVGKISDKWASYFRVYDQLLLELRDRPVCLLEIGVQNGGSLELWSQYFTMSDRIIGCDSNKDCEWLRFDDRKIHVVIGDVNSNNTKTEIVGHCAAFDIIIDDGSHSSSDIIKSFFNYFAHLSEGGIYIIEDLHCSYWQSYDGGLHHPYSSISFLKYLVDIVNFEHWGISSGRSDYLNCFAEYFDIALDEVQLSLIRSVEFVNSMCVIKKGFAADAGLGIRVISGSEALVYSGVVASKGLASTPPDQSDNPWSAQKSNRSADIVIPPLTHDLRRVNEIELFFDSRKGFGVEENMRYCVEPHQEPQVFRFEFPQSIGLAGLRLDPFNDSVVLEILEMTLVGSRGDINLLTRLPTNACTVDGNAYYFDNADPQIFFDGVGKSELEHARSLHCRLRYLHTGRSAVHATLHQFALHQERRESTDRATLATLTAQVQTLKTLQPVFDNTLALLRVEHERALALATERNDALSAASETRWQSMQAEYAPTLQRLQQQHAEAQAELARTLATEREAHAKSGQQAHARDTAQREHFDQTLDALRHDYQQDRLQHQAALEALQKDHAHALEHVGASHAHAVAQLARERDQLAQSHAAALVAASDALRMAEGYGEARTCALQEAHQRELDTLRETLASAINAADQRAADQQIAFERGMQALSQANADAIAAAQQREHVMQAEWKADLQSRLDQQRHQHEAAIAVFEQALQRQSHDHERAVQALQQAHAAATALAERRLLELRAESTAAIVQLHEMECAAVEQARQDAEAREMAHAEQTAALHGAHFEEKTVLEEQNTALARQLGTVQGWRGYALLARLQRSSKPAE